MCKFNRSFIQLRHFTITFGSLNPCLDFVLRVLSLLFHTEQNCCAQLSCLRHSTYGTSGKVTCRTITRLRLIISVASFILLCQGHAVCGNHNSTLVSRTSPSICEHLNSDFCQVVKTNIECTLSISPGDERVRRMVPAEACGGSDRRA